MYQQFDESNFHRFCNLLTKKDKELRNIIRQHGYPPMWTRPNTFQTLILTILEQQVSLAAAYAAFKKLKEKIGYVTPQKILQLSDEEMRACYFTRQKMGYARHLAEAIIKKQISLKKLSLLPDEEVREQLIRLKGIGHWTIDVYLMLDHRCVFNACFAANRFISFRRYSLSKQPERNQTTSSACLQR